MNITRQPVPDLQSTCDCESALTVTATTLMRRLMIAMAALLLSASGVWAENAYDVALKLTATSSISAPYITLHWTTPSSSVTVQPTHNIYRRLKGVVGWGTPVAALNASTTPVPSAAVVDWADATALPNVEYEYWVDRQLSGVSYSFNSHVTGYLMAGSRIPAVESRGKILLAVDSALTTPLAKELDQLNRDLIGDGWTPQTIAVSTVAAVTAVKSQIVSAYNTDPTNVRAVFLIGHIPVPYSGDSSTVVDGHDGAPREADGYYGDMNGTWTDTKVNSTTIGNVPGDGKFDQAVLPSPVELMVGRVDLSRLTLAPDTSYTEVDLMRRYFNKLHDYKLKRRAYANVSPLMHGADSFIGEASKLVGTSYLAWAYSCCGGNSVLTGDLLPMTDGRTFLIANASCTGGVFPLMGSRALGTLPFRAVFYPTYTSGMSYWNSPDHPLRAALAGNPAGDNLVLATMCMGRNHWFMHSMATGNPIGHATLMSMNSQLSASTSSTYNPAIVADPGGPSLRGTTINFALMGDPTMRASMVAPPLNLSVRSVNGQVNLSWTPSVETTLSGYYVYRATTASGPFTRLTVTPISGSVYTDTTVAAGTAYTYMVRALKMETSPGGTYENLSVGDPVTIVVNAAATDIPATPGGLSIALVGGSAALTWIDNASDETSYRVERQNGTGAFAAIATLPVNATSYTDPGHFSGITYYRVVAVSANSDSAPSNVAAFENRPGLIRVEPNSTSLASMLAWRAETGEDIPSGSGGPNSGLERDVNFIGTRTAPPVIPVSRVGGTKGPASVQYASNSSSDIAVSGTLQWADGDGGIKYIAIPVASQSAPQHPQQVRVLLSNNVGAAMLPEECVATCIIIDSSAPLINSASSYLTPWSEINASSRVTVPNRIDTGTGLSISSALAGIKDHSLGRAGSNYESPHMIYQTMSGDGSLTCFIPAASLGQSNVLVGVDVRADGTVWSAHVGTIVSSAGAMMGSRSAYGLSTPNVLSAYTTPNPAFTAPCWIRVARTGTKVTSSASLDGKSWTVLGSATIATLPAVANWCLEHASWYTPGDFHVATFQKISLITATSPTITSLSPSSGTAAGGTTVTITGTNLTGTSSVTFGGAAATSVTVVNSTTVTCVTPANAGGAVNLVLATPVGSATSANGYNYVNDAPVITAQAVASQNPTTTGSATLSVAASDADGDSLICTWSKVSGTGNVTFTPDDKTAGAFSTASFSAAGTYVLRATVTDGQGGVVTSDVTVTYNIPTCTITATQGAGGVISPSGAVTVNSGASQMFTITPTAGYKIAGVTVDDSALGTAVTNYTFSNVTTNHSIAAVFAAITNSLPSPWSGQDVGLVGAAGSASHSAGTFTVKGAGSDIGGAADSFHYAYQGLTGDGTIVGRLVTSQGTKVGLMIREALDANSKHVMLEMESSVLPRIGWRSSTGVGTDWMSGVLVQALPQWLKLQRIGNLFTGSISADGTNWTVVGSVSVTMNAGVYAGMIECSRNISNPYTSTFDTVTVGSNYTLTAWAGPNGSISPSGAVVVNSGASQTFAIIANAGYQVAGVTVDGAAIGAVTSYKFANVTATHTIVATFKVVPNQPPVAVAGFNQVVTNTAACGAVAVTLDGSRSADLESALSFEWRENGTVVGTTATVVTNLLPGLHDFSLVVTDNGGLTSTDSVSVVVVDVGLKLDMTMNEGVGLMTTDYSTSSNDGVLTNGVVWVAGPMGGHGISFNGSNSYVQLEQSLLPVLGRNATLTCWVRTTQVGNNTCWMAPGITGVEQAGGANDVFWGWLNASGQIGINSGDNGAAMSTNAVNDGAWHHVAFTRDAVSGQVATYVDGILQSRVTSRAGLVTPSFSSIGRIEDTGNTPAYFKGELDELRVYNAVLTYEQIIQIYLGRL